MARRKNMSKMSEIMTVDQLMKELSALSQNGQGNDYIVLSKDEEGNGFSFLTSDSFYSDGYMSPDGEFISEEDFAEYGYNEEECSKVVCLWPL